MDRLSELTAFVVVATEENFSKAAAKLRLSPSTVTRMVASLEGRLGVQLLARTTRSVVVTDTGSRFLDRARLIMAEVEDAEESVRGERIDPTGKLTVTAPTMF